MLLSAVRPVEYPKRWENPWAVEIVVQPEDARRQVAVGQEVAAPLGVVNGHPDSAAPAGNIPALALPTLTQAAIRPMGNSPKSIRWQGHKLLGSKGQPQHSKPVWHRANHQAHKGELEHRNSRDRPQLEVPRQQPQPKPQSTIPIQFQGKGRWLGQKRLSQIVRPLFPREYSEGPVMSKRRLCPTEHPQESLPQAGQFSSQRRRHP